MDNKQFTPEEIDLAYCKHFAWETLNNYIILRMEKDGEYPEFADNWKNEFFCFDNVNDIQHFIKYFERQLYMLKNNN